VLSQAACLSV